MLLVEANILIVLLKTLGAAVMAVAGGRLLWLAHVDRTPHLAARRSAKRLVSRPAVHRPVIATPAPARLAAGLELRRLTDVIETARTRVQTINANQRSAAGHLDSAEVALTRLIGEIAGIMPASLSGAVTQKVQPLPQMTPRRALAA